MKMFWNWTHLKKCTETKPTFVLAQWEFIFKESVLTKIKRQQKIKVEKKLEFKKINLIVPF